MIVIILGQTSLQATLSQELIVFARKALLDVVHARYMHCIHTGKIGNSVMASKILLYSVDVAIDQAHVSLCDWACVEASLTPSAGLIWFARTLDNAFVAMLGTHPGLLGFVDAYNERNALYVLINYIDAHEYALNRLNFILGMDDIEDDGGSTWNAGSYYESQQIPAHHSSRPSRSSRSVATDFSRLEAHQVILETNALVSGLIFGVDNLICA